MTNDCIKCREGIAHVFNGYDYTCGYYCDDCIEEEGHKEGMHLRDVINQRKSDD